MTHEYVEERDGGLYVAGSRVSPASIIYAFRDGASPESIQQSFPTLSLAQVYGAAAFYMTTPRNLRLTFKTWTMPWPSSSEPGNRRATICEKDFDELRRRRSAGQT